MIMSTPPIFDDSGSIFLGSKRSGDTSKIAIYGVPYDGTTSFRPGTRFGPSAIRNISNGIECYCPEFNLDLEDINFALTTEKQIRFNQRQDRLYMDMDFSAMSVDDFLVLLLSFLWLPLCRRPL